MAQGIKKVSENVIMAGRALTLTDSTIVDTIAIPNGALRCNLTAKGLEYKSAPGIYSKFDAVGLLLDGSITHDLLATDSVITEKIKDLNVTTIKIDNLAVTNQKLANYSVSEIKLASDSVSEAKIQINAVTETKIKDRSITDSKIKLKGILAENIGDNQIINRTISSSAVDERTLATDSVTTTKLKDHTITNEKFSNESIYGDAIKISGIETGHLKDQCVTSVKLADGAVLSEKIGQGEVKNVNISDLAINTRNIMNNAVTKSKLAENAVGNINIENSSVSYEKLTDSLKKSIDDAVKYENDNVNLRKDLNVKGNIKAEGTIDGARILNAVYMDLAEAYVPGEELEVGDIVEIREDGKIYKSTLFSNAVVGVVSDQYAACFGATPEELRDKKKVAIGLIGKVPVKINGSVNIGDKIGIGDNGIGMRSSGSLTNVVGKALESNSKEGINKVLCLIYPN